MRSLLTDIVRSAKRVAQLALLAALATALPAVAEVEKSALSTGDGIQMYWWPKLPALEGWSPDPVASMQYGNNVLAPAGHSFADADAVIFANARYKPRLKDIASLAELIAGDRHDFAERVGGVKVRDAARLQSAYGYALQCLALEPVFPGNWERVCYLEEGEYYLTFTLRARSHEAYVAAARAFETLISRYHE